LQSEPQARFGDYYIAGLQKDFSSTIVLPILLKPLQRNTMERKTELIDLTAEIVAAYVSNNTISATDLPVIIRQVYGALDETTRGTTNSSAEPPAPAVSIRRSVTPDYIICLEDGKKFKSLKRHLRTHYDMSPEEYRVKWGLPADYPMVAPNYARARSTLAKEMGLGQKGRTRRKRS
jgi:predicted transcriptional regulator